jgi:hypothetical protein
LIEKIDRFGTMSDKLAASMKRLAPMAKKVADLKAELVEEGLTFPADETVTLEGESYDIEQGVRAMKVTDINRPVLRKILGKETFDALWSIGISDIRKYCTPPQIEKVLTEARDGGRSFKVVKK